MASRTILIVVLALAPALAGCLTSESVIRLRADGSGTVESVVLVNEDAMRGMGSLFGAPDGDGDKAGSTSGFSFDPDSLRADVEKLGRGVRFVSSEPVTRGALKGARMVYAFDDVNALRIDPDPSGLSQGGAGGNAPIALRMTRQANGNAVLTITFDDTPPSSSSPQPESTPGGQADGFGLDLQDMPPGMEAMIAEMFNGFRVAIDIEVDGAIVRTSSPFVAGSRVTVLEMDLGALLKDKTGMTRLTSIPPSATPGAMAAAFKGVTGVKFNESPLTIEFAAR